MTSAIKRKFPDTLEEVPKLQDNDLIDIKSPVMDAQYKQYLKR